MKIAILGGGNIGSLMAAEFSSRGHDVWIVARDAEAWSSTMSVYDGANSVIISDAPIHPTTSIEEAVEHAEYIWITHPTQVMGETASQLTPFVSSGQKIGVVPGACAELFFREALAKGCILFGLQRVHSVARVIERGKSVSALGDRRSELLVASIPAASSSEIAADVSRMFEITTKALPNYLCLTLVPSNPILHTTRIRSMFRDWSPSVSYPDNILFYESWDDVSSELLIGCDAELQDLCNRLPLDLTAVKSLKDHYESYSAQAMTRKISTIPAFKGLLSPMRELSAGGWVPDFSSRYFESDFRYGLRCIQEIARLASVPTPLIDEVLSWFYEVTGECELNLLPFQEFGELIDFYS